MTTTTPLYCIAAVFFLFAALSTRATDNDIVEMAYRTRLSDAIDTRLDHLVENQVLRINPSSHEAWIEHFFWLTLDSPHKLLLVRMLALHCNLQITIYSMETGRTLVTYTRSQGFNFAPKPGINPAPLPLIPRAAPWLR